MPTFASFDDVPIAFHESGEGPAVVLVHGYTGDFRSNFGDSGIASAITDAGYRVVALDLRGHGGSGKPHDFAAYENKALARDVVALADHVGLDRYHLIGYSLGAIVAASVVLLDPRVRSVALGGMGDRLLDPAWDRPHQLVKGLMEGASGQTDDVAVGRMIKMIEARGGDPIALAGVQHGHVAVTAHEFANVSVPALVFAGIDDDVNGDPAGLAAVIPGAQLVRTPGDHMSAIPTPELRAAIIRFLKRISG